LRSEGSKTPIFGLKMAILTIFWIWGQQNGLSLQHVMRFAAHFACFIPLIVPRSTQTSLLRLRCVADKSTLKMPLLGQKVAFSMKKMIGMIALCVFGLAAVTALAQAPVTPVMAVETPAMAVEVPAVVVEEPTVVIEEPVVMMEEPAMVIEEPAMAVEVPAVAVEAPAAQELTIQGEVSVVNGPDGALQLIFINPADSLHGYKVDLVNGEGKTLAEMDGQVVEAVGVDANRLFTIHTLTVVE
jgi:hypothetical protein